MALTSKLPFDISRYAAPLLDAAQENWRFDNGVTYEKNRA
jgi:hypothetical protein